MDYATNAVFSSLISFYLPIEDNMMKIQIGIILSGLFSSLLKFDYISKIKRLFFKPDNHVIINETFENSSNMIYTKVEEYIVDKYLENITSSELIPKRGDIVFMINNNSFKEKIKITFEEHECFLYFKEDTKSSKNENENENNNKFSKKNKSIFIESKTASQHILKKYILDICKFKKEQSQILNIYRISTSASFDNKDDQLVSWDCIQSRCNKNYNNTVVSDKLQKDLYDDISWFIENEDWYSNKGIPYKRGYILYGPPGTGKTSLIKAIANTHNLPVFNLDFESIKTNNDLLKLVTDINYLVQNGRYILALEDIDRSTILKKMRRYYYESNSNVSIDCILNVLDGIMETYGRIVIMTANEVDVIKEIPALIRPGRIDKCILIDYCSVSQIKKFIFNFFGKEVSESSINITKPTTPAQYIKYMQQNVENLDKILDNLDNISPKLIEDEFNSDMDDNSGFSSSSKNGITFRRKNGKLNKKKNLVRNIQCQKYNYKKAMKTIKRYKKNKPVLEKRLEKYMEEETQQKMREKIKRTRCLEKRRCGHIIKNGGKCRQIVKRVGMKCRFHKETID